jgi:hypothetical protein
VYIPGVDILGALETEEGFMQRKSFVWPLPVGCVLTFALWAPAAGAATILPGVQASVSLTGQADAGPIELKEVDLNNPSFNPIAEQVTSLPVLGTIAGLGDSACSGASISGAASAANVTQPAVLVW